MNKFTTFLVVKVILSCFKQLPLNSTLILELLIHLTFGERLLFAVTKGLNFSFESVIPTDVVKESRFSWNIKKFFNPSLLK